MTDRSKATTHADDCWSWGPAHYECAVREIKALRKMYQGAYQRGLQAGSKGLREIYDAIQAVKRQDAWDNTRLTEALMAAEERADRAEAENKRLREELSKMRAEPSDEEIDSIAASMPDGAGGMLKQWGYRQFARALLSRYGRPAGDAQPVAWVAVDTLNSPHPVCVSSLAYVSQLDKDRGREYVPLYAAPVAAQAQSDDALDAARYRWLRTRWGRIADEYDGDSDQLVAIREADSHFEGWYVDPVSLDRAIDAAMQRTTAREGE